VNKSELEGLVDSLTAEIKRLKKEAKDSLKLKKVNDPAAPLEIPEGSIRISPKNPYFTGIVRAFQQAGGGTVDSVPAAADETFGGLVLTPGAPGAVEALKSFHKRSSDEGERQKLAEEIEIFENELKR